MKISRGEARSQPERSRAEDHDGWLPLFSRLIRFVPNRQKRRYSLQICPEIKLVCHTRGRAADRPSVLSEWSGIFGLSTY